MPGTVGSRLRPRPPRLPGEHPPRPRGQKAAQGAGVEGFLGCRLRCTPGGIVRTDDSEDLQLLLAVRFVPMTGETEKK